jgi:adenylate cyclase class IV
MQVEVKLTIADSDSFEVLLRGLHELLGQPVRDVQQRNVFLDGPKGELAAANAVCRVRTESIVIPAEQPIRSTVVLKEHNEVEDGASARFVVEAAMPGNIAGDDLQVLEEAVAHTSVGAAVRDRFGQHITLRQVGSFDNQRTVFLWKLHGAHRPPLAINVDRTWYPFGEGYELEVPCTDGVCVDEVIDGLFDATNGLLNLLRIPQDRVALGGRSKFQTYADGMSTMTASSSSHMRVEAKVLLPGVMAYERLLARMITHHKRTDVQRNYFYDSVGGELSSQGAFLRVRANGHGHTITIKEHSDVAEGSGISWQQEEPLPADVAASIIDNLDISPLFQLRASAIAGVLSQRFGLDPSGGCPPLRLIGGFENRRSVFAWPDAQGIQAGIELRIDETTFAGQAELRHEVEVPDVRVPVHDVLDVLQSTLNRFGINAVLCERSKFQQMLAIAQRVLQ